MDVVKIRRVGNSSVVSVPRKFVRAGYEDGQLVTIEQLPNGDLVIRRVEGHQELLRAAMSDFAKKHRVAFDKLAAYDRGEIPAPSRRRRTG